MTTIFSTRRGFGALPFTLGTWPMSGGKHYGAFDEREAIATIHAAVAEGVESFDTAPGYGRGYAESLLGRALKGRRHNAIITTKFGVLIGRGRDSSRASISLEIDQSLQRLRTDYIDYYVGHWPDQNTPLEETMGTLGDLLKAGKIRQVGLSNYTLDLVRRCSSTAPVHVVQVGYSLFDRRMADQLFSYCIENGIKVMAYGPLAHGLLIDDIAEDTTYGDEDWRSKGYAIGQALFTRENFRANVKVVQRLRAEIAAPNGLTVAQLALSWVLRNPAVTTVLVGARTRDQLHEDLATPVQLSDSDLAAIDEIMSDAKGLVDQFRPYARGSDDWSK